MTLKEEVEQGKLNIDADAPADRQAHNPVLCTVQVGEHLWPGISRMVSLGPEQFGMEFPVKDDGSPLMCDFKEGDTPHVDFKEALKTSKPVEIVIREKDQDGKEKDAVAFTGEVVKLRDDLTKGQVLVRYATLNVVGWREPLDFEPPVLTMPKQPFGEGK